MFVRGVWTLFRECLAMSKKVPPGKPAHSATKSPAQKRTGPSARPAPDSLLAAVPVVGVGASAGGLEAFRELLEALPNNTGMAFVLVSHLSKTYKSMLSELLGKVTRMPVAEVRGQTPVLANHIYVIPPNATLAMEDGGLAVRPIQIGPDENRHGMVIDGFFRSLAEHRKSQAIGVVLSGTGTDGTLGLAAIKAEGGIAFAQDQQSAKYPDMPRSASAQFGSADFVLPPAQIAKELARIAGHPYVRRAQSEEEAELATAESQFAGIFQWVKRSTGVDFSQYKPGTLRRRILRRMVLNKMETVGSYLARLQSDPSEVEALYRDLLINVTSFFRDPETFECLKSDVIPDILNHRHGDLPIRVWVPGCATGEEAYSIAILLLECLQSSGAGLPVQIFASDISKQAIQVARDGQYPENIAADVSPERLQKFFTKSNGGYQVNEQVRDFCIFAVQDVTRDPPFSRMDLISCRNLLIYLGVPLQKKVLAAFHYALNPEGYLLLGSSESVEAGWEAFRQVDKKYKIYSRLFTSARQPLEFHPAELTENPVGVRRSVISQPEQELGREADRIVLSRYAPPGVLVNSSLEVLQFRGRTGPFLEQPAGHATLNLLKMAREGLSIDLRAAIHQAKKTGAAVRKTGVRVRGDSGTTEVALEVTPVIDKSLPNNAKNPCYLVLFETTPPAKAVTKGRGAKSESKASSSSARELAALRGELAGTQNDLRSIIEEQEATNQELQSANEEILSSNEELQSTNEELETAKEELQATNEELITVNEELQNRNVELAKVNTDLTNLIESVDVVFVMLDRELRIRRFTSAAQKVLNLIPSDVGRSIGDIKPNIQIDDLPGLIRGAIVKMRHYEQNVQDLVGRSYAMKIRPSKTPDGTVEGAILALTDIDTLLRSQENRQSLETSLRSLLKQPPDLLLAVSPAGQPLFVSSSVLAATRATQQSLFEYVAPQDREPLRRCLQQALETRATAEIEVRRFVLRPAKGPIILAVEPIVTMEGVLALSVRAREAAAGNNPASRTATIQ
jgi:two-component system, chemotaxis family, CheB/CheR fusion protein